MGDVVQRMLTCFVYSTRLAAGIDMLFGIFACHVGGRARGVGASGRQASCTSAVLVASFGVSRPRTVWVATHAACP